MTPREAVAPDALTVLGTLGLKMNAPEQRRRVKLAEWIARDDHPDRVELLETMSSARRELVDWITSLPESKLADPVPEPYREFAPDYLSVPTTLTWHEGFHAGQLSAIRRSLGLPRIFG